MAEVNDVDPDEIGSEPIEVGAGRPSCPLCGYPMNPEGHVCPQPGAP